MYVLRSLLACLAFCLFLSVRAEAQRVYYNASSATQTQNQLDSVATNGTANTALFTAGGSVSRCTSMGVDVLNGKLFFIDGPSSSIWSVNLDGSGLALVRSAVTDFPMDLALDVLNQRIYFTTSSTLQSNNTVQATSYTGTGSAVLFTASGASGNGVSRCTAIALDTANSKIFLADAGARRIWSLNLAGSGLAALATTTNCFPTGLAVDSVSRQVYFTAGSAVQASNFIQRVNYDGSGLTTRFTASGSVQRCTALDLDLANSVIYLSDAGANTLWRMPLAGGAASSVVSGLPATAKKVRWFGGPFSRPAPGITAFKLSGTNALLTATNGFAGGTYYVFTSTNVALPLSQWTPASTNLLPASGTFTLTLTNTVAPGTGQRFYVLAVQ